ncbi:hypothetical protein OOJ09_22085 [Mesorhizobium qingshengii]|uniref:Uncharacterized protein n=1 Tax=Mesorhizobium qingshengii TaxID=1165689 RepID=A0ABT4QZ92_9HYPH|nr:hypothetical protein [Mesorhizobium qingshengii]MCZ8546885.1 hypothetical protein [Mesorhizobium qingshengii]
MAITSSGRVTGTSHPGKPFRNSQQAVFLRRNQMARRALLKMDSRKPYETPKWWPGGDDREAMCCSFCGGRDHRYEQCPQRNHAIDPSSDTAGDALPRPALF